MAKKKQQKQNFAFWIILAVIVAGGIWYYYTAPKAVETPVAKEGIKEGDLVAINYVLAMSDGRVIDTNSPELAEQNNITSFSKGPFRFIVGQSGKIKGFDNAILGASLGDNLTKVIEPTEPVIKIVVNKTRQISRNMPLPRFQTFTPTAYVKYFNKTAVIGDTASNPYFPWAYKVVNVSENNHIVCDPIVVEGKSYKLPSLEWNSSLLATSYNDLVFRHNPKEGQLINTEFGEATVAIGVGKLNITYKAPIGRVVNYSVLLEEGGEIALPQRFKITDANDLQFEMTRIDHLAQETLVLAAEILEWTPDVKEVKEPLKAKVNAVAR
jgi:hypothetical protein